MGEEMDISCARPTGGPVDSLPKEEEIEGKEKILKEVKKTMVKVGQKAPDF